MRLGIIGFPQSGKTTMLRRGQVRPHVFEVQVEADIAIEIPVVRVAWISFVATPHLFGRFEVAPKHCDPVGREHRRKDAIAGTGLGIQQAMGIQDTPPNVGFLQHLLHSDRIGAFGEPDTARIPAKASSVVIPSHLSQSLSKTAAPIFSNNALSLATSLSGSLVVIRFLLPFLL